MSKNNTKETIKAIQIEQDVMQDLFNKTVQERDNFNIQENEKQIREIVNYELSKIMKKV